MSGGFDCISLGTSKRQPALKERVISVGLIHLFDSFLIFINLRISRKC